MRINRLCHRRRDFGALHVSSGRPRARRSLCRERHARARRDALALVRSGTDRGREPARAQTIVLLFPDNQSDRAHTAPTGPEVPDRPPRRTAIAAGRVNPAPTGKQVDSETCARTAPRFAARGADSARRHGIPDPCRPRRGIPGTAWVRTPHQRAARGIDNPIRSAKDSRCRPHHLADLERIAVRCPRSPAVRAASRYHATGITAGRGRRDALRRPRHLWTPSSEPPAGTAPRRAGRRPADAGGGGAFAAASPATMISAAEPQPASLPVRGRACARARAISRPSACRRPSRPS